MAADKRFLNSLNAYETTQNVTDINVSRIISDPVGQIVEFGENGEVIKRFCSGFNIAGGKYFFTASHCISSAYANTGLMVCYSDDKFSPMPKGNCGVHFGYQAIKEYSIRVDDRMVDVYIPESGYLFKILPKPVDQGFCEPAKIDYGVLQLSHGAARFGSLDFSDMNPPLKSEIFLIHHPSGIAKRYSEGRVSGYSIDCSRFVYNAGTHGGSSGAPVLSKTTGKVVGLHVTGDETTQNDNTAVVISKILSENKGKEWCTFFHNSSSSSSSSAGVVEVRNKFEHPANRRGCC